MAYLSRLAYRGALSLVAAGAFGYGFGVTAGVGLGIIAGFVALAITWSSLRA